jgi:LL-diaminopimelate aminotransferase
MARVNEHYRKLQAGYLFPEIGRRVRAFQEQNPDAKIIRMGIGDVVLPLAPAVREAMHRAIDELGTDDGFRGYPPDQGYDFLREAIAAHEFAPRGVRIAPDEIFVSDGSKCDTGNFQEIFALDARVAVPDPVYPVYVDTNVMAGRTGAADAQGRFEGIVYLPCTEANGFVPEPPREKVDLVYLCSPNNPTGSVASRESLERWVRWAQQNDAVILFDAAYAAYVTDPYLPRSIYEIPGAREVAVEFRSYSKAAGFTGVRCAFVVVPRELRGVDASGAPVELHALWQRRHSTKFNGVSYPVQCGAAATYTEAGKAQTLAQVRYYLENAALVRKGLADLGLRVFGGTNAPYVWVATPRGTKSWDFFDVLLTQAHVVVTPGAGFGPHGEGYFRVSSFARRAQVVDAVDRIRTRVKL